MSTLFSHFSQNINQISPLESKFTEVLECIALKPKTLYFYGKIPENMSKTVAIVGSRHNTPYGKEVAYDLASKLAREGVIIVSGLAFGIDSIGHRATLDTGGVTVAVLGTPIDQIYPRAHTGLAREIVESGGLILSEYAPDRPEFRSSPLAPGEYYDNRTRKLAKKAAFLYRNRLIAGLSDAVVVVEAAERSGSLNTAHHALEQGKEVFAVPGNITSPYSVGCNKLIAEGATPCLGAEDILDYLFPDRYLREKKKDLKSGLIGSNDIETAILKAISEGYHSSEEIMTVTKMPPEVFSQSITMLEIGGRIGRISHGSWSLT